MYPDGACRKGAHRPLGDAGEIMKVVVTALFGVESVVADELVALGYPRERITVSDAQVVLDPGSTAEAALAVARANVWLRTGERVLASLGSFLARDFDALFDQTQLLPWEEWIPRGAEFIVNGYSRKSALFGIPACQRTVKKAIVARLLRSQGLPETANLPENAAHGSIRIQFSIVADEVTFMVDTSGDGLHKRGYRPLRHEAPIRETLAAAMLSLSRYQPMSDEVLFDPFCGSGTFTIEAAMIACQMAPGRARRFAGENWPLIGKAAFDRAREEASDRFRIPDRTSPFIFGTDIDPLAIRTASENAARAGVADYIRLGTADALSLTAERMRAFSGFERFLVVGNPPYGERLLDMNQANDLIAGMSRTFFEKGKARRDLRLSFISPEDGFERLIGGPADKRRKLYNGMIKCTMYHYFKHPFDPNQARRSDKSDNNAFTKE